MSDLRLDGIEVSTSGLTQKSFSTGAAYCRLLLDVTPKNKAKALAAFKETRGLGAYSGLRISGIADLSFLKDFPNLLYLEIAYQEDVNARYLDSLENLRGLHLNSPGAGIDFACFPELEVFSGDWHADNRSLDQSRELRTLSVWHFKPRSRDLLDLADITRLEWLTLVQTNISSLAGLETLEDLRYFDVAYAPKLESLDELATGGTGIRELSLDHVKKVQSYRPIASISHLRQLLVSDCAPMPDLKWVDGLDFLDFFSFVGTNVEDGDLSPLLSLPKLRYVGTMNKRHYNYKSDMLNGLLNQRISATPGAPDR